DGGERALSVSRRWTSQHGDDPTHLVRTSERPTQPFDRTLDLAHVSSMATEDCRFRLISPPWIGGPRRRRSAEVRRNLLDNEGSRFQLPLSQQRQPPAWGVCKGTYGALRRSHQDRGQSRRAGPLFPAVQVESPLRFFASLFSRVHRRP